MTLQWRVCVHTVSVVKLVIHSTSASSLRACWTLLLAREHGNTVVIYMLMTGCVIDRCAFTILYRTITDQFMNFQLVCRDVTELICSSQYFIVV